MSTPPPPSSSMSTPQPAQKRATEPNPATEKPKLRVKKRIIVLCDGTWQDGLRNISRNVHTNVLRLARAIKHDDDRHDTIIPQVVFYQAGIGSESNLYAHYIEGTTGSSLAEKVQEAYGFIAHNYLPGDEIFLFGFSRGAYTARMVAMFIGEIGVLDRTEMDAFADIFIAYQKRGKAKSQAEIDEQNKILAPWNQRDSSSKKRADWDEETFSIKCVGVFDTVGSLGLPEELPRRSAEIKNLFGFPDTMLGEHIERAYHALAIHEARADFDCCKFEQREGGRRKGQVLKQCWFAGSHSDIGGGYERHDLADLTLSWMAANVGDIVSLDTVYLSSISNPYAPWGEQEPNDSRKGIFKLSDRTRRELPTSTDDITCETIHPSVLCQKAGVPEDLAQWGIRIAPLLPLEEELKVNWPQRVTSKEPDSDEEKTQIQKNRGAVLDRLKDALRITPHSESEEAEVITSMKSTQ